jgi:hypothetical protein
MYVQGGLRFMRALHCDMCAVNGVSSVFIKRSILSTKVHGVTFRKIFT